MVAGKDRNGANRPGRAWKRMIVKRRLGLFGTVARLLGAAAALAVLGALGWRNAVPWSVKVFVDGKLNRAVSDIHGVIVAAGVHHWMEGDYMGISIRKLRERGDIPLRFTDGVGENAHGGDIRIAGADGGAVITYVSDGNSRGNGWGNEDCRRAALRFSGHEGVVGFACDGTVLRLVLE